MRIFPALLLFSICCAINCINEAYEENLTLKLHSNDELQADFRFSMERNYSQSEHRDYVLFPRIIQSLVDKYDISHLTISMGQGRWRAANWGIPPQPSPTAGAQLYVVFKAGSEEEADKKLKFVIEALNGILCTSISHLPVIMSPKLPIFAGSETNNKGLYKRYGVVSGETTCTENLTRLRKLLACKENGISTLLHPSKLYDSIFHSSHLIIDNLCQNEKCEIKLEVGVTSVFRNPNKKGVPHFMTSNIFDKKLSSKCAAARKSSIDVIYDEEYVHVDPKGEVINEIGEDKKMRFDLKKDLKLEEGGLDIELRMDKDWPMEMRRGVVRMWSSQGGFDQHSGDLRVSIQQLRQSDDHTEKSESEVTVSQIIPYFVKIRYHKVIFECKSEDGNKVPIEILDRVFRSTRAEKRPTLMQYKLRMRGAMTCELLIPFEKKLLRLDEYPPDANHGMHVPAAVAHVTTTNSSQSYSVHSNAILVALPVPDFSMPFNVICFVATLFSLIYGPIQCYSTMWLGPAIQTGNAARKLWRMLLILLIALAGYAHYHNISIHEIRRTVGEYWEKLNEMK